MTVWIRVDRELVTAIEQRERDGRTVSLRNGKRAIDALRGRRPHRFENRVERGDLLPVGVFSTGSATVQCRDGSLDEERARRSGDERVLQHDARMLDRAV